LGRSATEKKTVLYIISTAQAGLCFVLSTVRNFVSAPIGKVSVPRISLRSLFRLYSIIT